MNQCRARRSHRKSRLWSCLYTTERSSAFILPVRSNSWLSFPFSLILFLCVVCCYGWLLKQLEHINSKKSVRIRIHSHRGGRKYRSLKEVVLKFAPDYFRLSIFQDKRTGYPCRLPISSGGKDAPKPNLVSKVFILRENLGTRLPETSDPPKVKRKKYIAVCKFCPESSGP